jgi:hypothetical protein
MRFLCEIKGHSPGAHGLGINANGPMRCPFLRQWRCIYTVDPPVLPTFNRMDFKILPYYGGFHTIILN